MCVYLEGVGGTDGLWDLCGEGRRDGLEVQRRTAVVHRHLAALQSTTGKRHKRHGRREKEGRRRTIRTLGPVLSGGEWTMRLQAIQIYYIRYYYYVYISILYV